LKETLRRDYFAILVLCSTLPDVVIRPGYRSALIETAVVMNAGLGAFTVQQGLTAQGEKRFGALYEVYPLQSRQNLGAGARWFGLVSSGCPTRDLEASMRISRAVAGCDKNDEVTLDRRGREPRRRCPPLS
jgi:hypothetical protein